MYLFISSSIVPLFCCHQLQNQEERRAVIEHFFFLLRQEVERWVSQLLVLSVGSWLEGGGELGGVLLPSHASLHHYGRDKQEAPGFDFLSQRKMRWLGEKMERLLLIGAGLCRTGGTDWSFRTNQEEQPAENRPPPSPPPSNKPKPPSLSPETLQPAT